MLKFVVIGGICAFSFLITGSTAQKNVGPGKWSVLNIMKCDNDDMMAIKLDTNRRKVNRTHDGFNCNITLDEPLDDTFAIRIDICKVVTGGCKDYNTMGDDSMIKFVKKFAEDNVRNALIAAGIDPPDFPIKPGFHSIKQFLFNYDEMPPKGPYGEFKGQLYLIKNGVEMACSMGHVLFEEEDK